jgi:hypothetical protein
LAGVVVVAIVAAGCGEWGPACLPGTTEIPALLPESARLSASQAVNLEADVDEYDRLLGGRIILPGSEFDGTVAVWAQTSDGEFRALNSTAGAISGQAGLAETEDRWRQILEGTAGEKLSLCISEASTRED